MEWLVKKLKVDKAQGWTSEKLCCCQLQATNYDNSDQGKDLRDTVDYFYRNEQRSKWAAYCEEVDHLYYILKKFEKGDKVEGLQNQNGWKPATFEKLNDDGTAYIKYENGAHSRFQKLSEIR